MKEEFSPSPDFVAKVMKRVHDYQAAQTPVEGFFFSRPLRYILAGGGTVFGILQAVPVF